MKFEIRVLRGGVEVARIKGEREVEPSEVTMKEVDQIFHTESLLEKLTGFRFHINQSEG